ncbi:MAG: hypothetical protein LKM35_08120 [Lachnospiraceae bacterium]|jgi:hypothetical protein|nr:hypothetical protein [Lachnospiraceae bacterium]
MHRSGLTVSCVLLLACLSFCGCASAQPAGKDGSTAAAESTAETESTVNPPVSENTDPASTAESKETGNAFSEKEVYQTEIPQGAEIGILSAYDSRLLITYHLQQQYVIAMLDTEDGSFREILRADGYARGAFLKNGDYYTLDSVNQEMKIYSHADDSVRNVYAASRNGIPNQNGEGIWDAQDMTEPDHNGTENFYVNHIQYEQGHPEKNAEGTAEEQKMPDAVFKLIYAEGPYLYYRYAKAGYYERTGPSDYNSTICRLNRETSETEEFADWIKGTDQPYGHKSVLYHSELLIPWENPGMLYTVKDADIMNADGSLLLLKTGDSLQLTDADASRMLLEVPFSSAADEWVSSAISREGRFIAVGKGRVVTVYRWKGEGSPASNAKSSRISDLEGRIQDETAELQDRYGITVMDEKMIGEEFQPQPLTSNLRKYAALLELNTVLGYFPEHMTEEIKPEGTGLFPICLAGDMSAAGLTSTISADGKFYMAFSTGSAYDDAGNLIPASKDVSLGETMIHEMMHAIGMRLESTFISGKSVMSLWDSMVPPESTDRAYQNTYSETWVGQYTLDDPTAAKDDIWFEDAYARTMPEEDRAEIFKSLFLGVHDNGESWDADYPNLLKKGRLLCAMIRYAFPSVRATPAGSMYWERNFGQVSLDTFIP